MEAFLSPNCSIIILFVVQFAPPQILKYSDQGDLTKYISRYFDTGSGGKREKESYIRISKDLDI